MTGYIGQAPGQGQIQYFTFTATAGQTTFTGIDDNKYVLNYDIGFCDVFLNGRRLTPNSDYTATDGSTVVLQSAASLNDVIFIASASTFSTANWVTNAVNYVYVATAGQTTFTGGDSNGNSLSYVNGTILVSVNGINLPQSDFTATNGSTVILNSGVNAGDIVQIFSLRTMAVSNFLPLTGGAISGSLTVGNSSVNTYITAGNIALNGSTLLIGNSTSNVVITGTTLTISNSTSNASFGTGPAAINAIATNTFTVGSTMYVVSNGNVGLGSSTPSATLDVVSNNNFGQLFLYKTSGGSDNYVRLNLQNSTGASYFQLAANPNSNSSLSLMNFYTSGSGGNILSLSGNGYVGIGNTTPQSKLVVEGSGHFRGITLSNTAGVDVGFNTNYAFITSGNRGANTLSPLDSEASYFRWLTGFGSSEQMRLNTTGLGIGTGSPAYKLDAYNSSAGDVSARFKASNGGAELLLDATNSFNSVRYLVSGTEKWRAGLVNSNNFVIYDYSAGTRMLVNSVGDIGIGEAAPVARLHVYQPNVQSYHGYATKFVDAQSASGNFIPHDFVQYYGNHSWGTVARFRIEAGSDKPSIQFSSVADNTRWNVGFCGYDESFRIVQNLGYRNDNSTQDGWGTERFKITNTGCITKPYQPAFISISKSGTFTYTGGQKVIYDQSVQNVGSNYSTASSRFTAPVAGFYLVKAQLWSHYTNVGCAWFYVNGSARYGSYGNEGQNISWNAYAMIEIFYLNANDYVEVYCRSGTVYTDSGFSTFSGYLLG